MTAIKITVSVSAHTRTRVWTSHGVNSLHITIDRPLSDIDDVCRGGIMFISISNLTQDSRDFVGTNGATIKVNAIDDDTGISYDINGCVESCATMHAGCDLKTTIGIAISRVSMKRFHGGDHRTSGRPVMQV